VNNIRELGPYTDYAKVAVHLKKEAKV